MRRSGIFLHITSLPSAYGIGSFGKEAFRFVDFLRDSGQRIWQILPLGPVCPEACYSPYTSYSTFAGNPLLIDLDTLAEEGYLCPGDLAGLDFGGDLSFVDYDRVAHSRQALLAKAYENAGRVMDRAAFSAFVGQSSEWLGDYAGFMCKKCGGEAEYYEFLQYLFYRQWGALKAYANRQGIQIFGDMPFYVPADSADFAANSRLFLLDEDRRIAKVAGVPPDAFSSVGQKWGFPLYDWERMRAEDYRWWIGRIRHALTLFDILRIDHFRAFDQFYAIPAEDGTAVNGVWMDGPGEAFFRALRRVLPGASIAAEDLGLITDGVRVLLESTGFPGMSVLQFAFGSDSRNLYLPHNHTQNSVVYTGTHDNNTTKGWLDTAGRNEFDFAVGYLRLNTYEKYTEGMIRAALGSVADTAVIPLADWLDLGESARMNTPGTIGGNWRPRVLKDHFRPELSRKIAYLTGLYGRI